MAIANWKANRGMRALVEEQMAEAASAPHRINPAEAPAGYRAVLKATVSGDGNICGFCDWREACQDPSTDLLAPGHRCMSVPVVASRDGRTYARADGCSVVFKRL